MTSPNQPASAAKWTPPVHMLLVVALWSLLVLIFALGLYLTGLSGPFPISASDAIYQAVSDWLPWLLVSPFILWLANRFRLERTNWRSSLAIHLAACLLLNLAYEAFLFYGQFRPPSMVIGRFGTEAGGLPHAVGNIMFHSDDTNHPVMDRHINDRVMIATRGEAGVAFNFSTTQIDADSPIPPWKHFFHIALVRGQFTLPLYWAMVVACWAANYYRESRERERRALELEASLSKANLQALKMQLQPHFLFNTLNAISALVHQNPDAADEMLGSLSDLLRMSLEFSDQHEVTLRQELEFLDCYLSIQQTRFGPRLRIRKDIEPITLDARVPTFVLQPFVENAVQHGIEPRKSGGTITLRSWHLDNRLYLEISDDGQGLAATSITSLKEGIGLANSKARLRELYGSNHHFSLKHNSSGGVCVTLEIPLQLADETQTLSPTLAATT